MLSHADTVRNLDRAKEQLASLQGNVREFQTKAETAEAKLLGGEQSWSAQREMLDKSISELADKYVIFSRSLSSCR